MIRPEDFAAQLAAAGVSLYCGVPDSLLKEFNACVSGATPPAGHVTAANEGNAVGLAIGHYLRTGSPALVYLQNSGLGNTVNPLASLADPEVYGIPMLVLIGWRGQPGVPDEPQHRKQGRITPALLDALELPWSVLPRETEAAGEAARKAVAHSVAAGTPYVLLVEKGTFARAATEVGEPPADEAGGSTALPSREEALVALADELGPGRVVVSSTGMLSRELFEYRERTASGAGLDFLTVGGMGHASSIALGIALHEPQREVWCLDGDGSLLMHLGALPVVAQHAPRTFFHVVFNNGVHDSVGGQPTSIDQVNVPALARSCGYRHATGVSSLAALPAGVAELREATGPALLEIRVRPGSRADLGRPRATPAESRTATMLALAEQAAP
ncbi:phosphoenolpyruvate decarboxylase [Streptomyces viridochromogenes]|uniref:Phosphonopyruvate decarboxylase n=1 Tax=Streptomyces viridochromogenes TaxID=1938 RepID=A0A0J7Z7C4_STRVR|nr:phosphonopyruvate decarboxylase [Streptomyces viridochromogenes]KMS72076.1 phosphoenolpyruvate decarboxylase [Streptomyces viridochromogenes]KOG08638.1 phosphoenolpyruvate decarboxylase [Streptomyces viridochromogenes]KOG08683.1 phosphoenolpyruvate decarboxylase [Streptomyces viridochromogenes]